MIQKQNMKVRNYRNILLFYNKNIAKGGVKMKEKKIVFNETIDNAISGYSLAITFISVGIF